MLGPALSKSLFDMRDIYFDLDSFTQVLDSTRLGTTADFKAYSGGMQKKPKRLEHRLAFRHGLICATKDLMALDGCEALNICCSALWLS